MEGRIVPSDTRYRKVIGIVLKFAMMNMLITQIWLLRIVLVYREKNCYLCQFQRRVLCILLHHSLPFSLRQSLSLNLNLGWPLVNPCDAPDSTVQSRVYKHRLCYYLYM